MAEAYTPGLLISESTKIVKRRILPLPGKLHVRKGDKVEYNTIVASTELPGPVTSVNIINALGITPSEINLYMTKKTGEAVKKEEVIAQSKPLFGIKWLQTQIKSPIDGAIDNISDVTGQVLIREPSQKILMNAYIDGLITEVQEGLGATVETNASYIQGIFGIGGENHGILTCDINDPDAVLDTSKITPNSKGKIIVTGQIVTKEHIQKAIKHGVKGIISGGIYDLDLAQILGYDIGVAITGNENIPITVVVTEGFGQFPIARKTFSLLRGNVGKECAINGTTQIRAGVQRPEIIIPIDSNNQIPPVSTSQKLEPGRQVRIIREPNFGKIATVTKVIEEPQVIETGSKIRVVRLKVEGGEEEVTVPRCNIELIS